MVINKLFYFLTIFLFLFNKEIQSSQILDFETEVFIDELINEIKVINSFDKKIEFKIISENSINAFVDENNIIYITSGLIENCDDYIALLSVIAHEVGHIYYNHIYKRILNNNKSKNINAITNLSMIASSMLFNNPELIKGIAISSGTLSEQNISFSKDQEKEADYYSLQTLKKMNLFSNSIIKLLLKIEKQSSERGLTKEQQKYSTHPYFEERINIINYLNENKGQRIDQNLDIKFKFIKAKFIGYKGDVMLINNLTNQYNLYANSILNAKKGNLKNSLIDLNNLISTYQKNFYLIETKADILFSFGYLEEAIKFYKKVLKKYPNNYYAQIRVFENTNFDQLTIIENENLFLENLNLLNKFYNNRNLLQIYLKLSKYANKVEWEEFLYYWLNKKNNKITIKKELENFVTTSDKELFDLVQLIYKNYQ